MISVPNQRVKTNHRTEHRAPSAERRHTSPDDLTMTVSETAITPAAAGPHSGGHSGAHAGGIVSGEQHSTRQRGSAAAAATPNAKAHPGIQSPAPGHRHLHADLPFLKRLVEDFVASFRSNELPRNLELQFLPGIGTKCCGGSHKQGCTLCRDILEHFPLDEDLLFLTCCYSLRKKIPIILSRTGGRELLQSKSVILRLLKRRRCLWEDHDQMAYDIDDYYPPAYLASAITFVHKDLVLFEDLVRKHIGFDPASLTREEVEEALGCWDRSGETACVVFVMQSAFERLVQVGFQLDVTHGTLNDWRDERALDSGIYVQADNDFERDTIDYYRCLPLEYQEDSSDDDEDIVRNRRAWNQKIGLS